MVWKWPFLLVHKQPTNMCMKLPTIPLGLAGKIVKNRPLSEPIRLQDLEDKFMDEFICLISLMEHYLLCTGKDFSTKLTWDLQRLLLIHVSKSRQESTCIYCSDNVKSVGSDDSRQQTNTPCAAKYVCGFCNGIAPLLGLFLLSFLKLINFSLCLNVFWCQLSDERCGVDKEKQQQNSKGRIGTGAVVLLLIIGIAAYSTVC